MTPRRRRDRSSLSKVDPTWRLMGLGKPLASHLKDPQKEIEGHRGAILGCFLHTWRLMGLPNYLGLCLPAVLVFIPDSTA